MEDLKLPKEWLQCALNDIAEINPSKIKKDQDIISGFVPMSHAPTNYIGELGYEERLWGEINKLYTNFQNDDVILAKVTPCFENGKAAIVRNMPNGIGAGSSEFYVLRPRNRSISSRYIFALLKTREFMQEGAANMTGAVGLRRVPKAFVENFIVPLPSESEQKIIADKLDDLLARVESIKTRLENIPEILKKFRQSVLSAAVSGKLTEEWRFQNSTSLEDWKYLSLSNIVRNIEAGKNIKCIEVPPKDNEVGIIKISAVTWGKYDEEESKTLEDDSLFIESRRICVGDFLISRANTLELLGNPVIVHSVTRNLMLSDKVLRLIMPDEDKLWVSIFLRSSVGRKEIESRSTGNQLSMRNIGQKSLLAIPLPYPESDEKREIVKKVEAFLTYAENIENQSYDVLSKIKNLTQSILAKAFRGELTAQWREENPELISGLNSAEALLEKITAEKLAAGTVKKRAKKTAH